MLALLPNRRRAGSYSPVLLLALLAFSVPTQAESKARSAAVRLPAPENLSAATRAEVRGRMGQHGNTMSNLVRALVLLDRPTIVNLAGRIADQEVVARTEGGGTDKLKLLLPKEFFAEEVALQTNARDLAASAANKEADSAMAERFAAVAKTCVACHTAYLHSPSDKGR
jgi:mono/diheme cytochrome c family protein